MINPVDTTLTSSVASDVNDAHAYYNKAQNNGLDRRNDSKILHLRNFNNWIKSTLCNEYLDRIRTEQPNRAKDISVFDMGCGKGGDQLKWQIGRVGTVIFADLAEKSVEICNSRYRDRQFCYKAHFYTLDCTKELLRDKIHTKEPCFDLVSSQFVLHYSFGKLEAADRFLRNAAEFLRVDGFFFGTTMNSVRLVELCRQSPNQTISNDVFSAHFDSSIDLSSTSNERIPLFGAKYDFSLDEVVNCPEYLVYYPLLKELAKKHGLEEVDRQTFKDYFKKNANAKEGRSLLAKMKALEYYALPTDNANEQQETAINHSQYQHAEDYMNQESSKREVPITCCRTLSKQEWDMTSLYITFAFQKKRQVTYEDDQIINE